MKLAGLTLPKAGGSTQNELLMWGGLGMLAIFTWGMLGTSFKNAGQDIENFSDSPFVSNIDKTLSYFGGWSEGMPYRDRSVWYQWKSDWQGNDPTKRLTVA
jgi:LPXTG-motif cell wall-anchored protein